MVVANVWVSSFGISDFPQLGSMSKLLNKVRNYVKQVFLIKRVYNKYWHLVDNNNGKVQLLFIDESVEKLQTYYPDLDLAEVKNTPNIYRFLLHLFSRYMYLVKDCVIEPDYNWVILGKGKLFRFSYPNIEDPWDAIKPRPSVLVKRPTKVLEKAILIRFGWTNYYHFFIDTLAQLYLFDAQGIPNDVPVIVPHYFDRYSFVKAFFDEFPTKRTIILQQKGEFIRVKELYVAKDYTSSDHIHSLREKIVAKGIAAQVQMEYMPNVFITRKKGSFRSIANGQEIEDIAKANGFAIIDPGEFTWKQQVKIFSEAKQIIGVHGAGVTNILYCQQPNVRILEIFPGKGIVPKHYKIISVQLGFEHHAIEGEGLASGSVFYLNPDAFKKSLLAFLAVS